jgi:hypothetical protein
MGTFELTFSTAGVTIKWKSLTILLTLLKLISLTILEYDKSGGGCREWTMAVVVSWNK